MRINLQFPLINLSKCVKTMSMSFYSTESNFVTVVKERQFDKSQSNTSYCCVLPKVYHNWKYTKQHNLPSFLNSLNLWYSLTLGLNHQDIYDICSLSRTVAFGAVHEWLDKICHWLWESIIDLQLESSLFYSIFWRKCTYLPCTSVHYAQPETYCHLP